MYFTSGSDRAFESLMQGKPGFDHYDSGDAGAPEDCGDCRFYRPDWKYQFCVYAECPYQPGKLTAYDAVKFQVKGVDDEMAVFRVEKNRGYTVMSNLYELDYPQHFRHVAAEAVQADNIILHYEKGDREQPAGLYFDGRPDPKLGAFLRYEAKPNEPEHLRELLRQEQKGRAQLAPGDFKAHVTALHDGMILAEAQRIVAGLKDLSGPNSPNKTHFMVELSPYFVQIASSKDTDRLFSMLPYKSLCFTGMKDRHGLYAVIGRDENRDKEVRRPRASIRRQLSESKQAQAPKKPPARTKKNELEV